MNLVAQPARQRRFCIEPRADADIVPFQAGVGAVEFVQDRLETIIVPQRIGLAVARLAAEHRDRGRQRDRAHFVVGREFEIELPVLVTRRKRRRCRASPDAAETGGEPAIEQLLCGAEARRRVGSDLVARALGVDEQPADFEAGIIARPVSRQAVADAAGDIVSIHVRVQLKDLAAVRTAPSDVIARSQSVGRQRNPVPGAVEPDVEAASRLDWFRLERHIRGRSQPRNHRQRG